MPTSQPEDVRPRPDAEQAGAQGQEQHRHFRFADGKYVWHRHAHTCRPEDFNRLHHHPPMEHDGLSMEMLRTDEEVRDV
jgi:hypothetical protein